MTARSLHPEHACAIDVLVRPAGILIAARCKCGEVLHNEQLRLNPRPKVRQAAWRRAFEAVRTHERAVGLP